jgi:hypothetical protein
MALGHGRKDSKLQTVGGRVIMGLPHIDQGNLGGIGQHLRLTDIRARSHMQDIAHFRLCCRRIGHLTIPPGCRGTAPQHQGNNKAQTGGHIPAFSFLLGTHQAHIFSFFLVILLLNPPRTPRPLERNLAHHNKGYIEFLL